MDDSLSDPYLDADRFAILEMALEKCAQRADESQAQAEHLATLLGESDSKRWEIERILNEWHNRFWTQLHGDEPCPACEKGLPT
jgi:hypothetical protein